MLKRDDTISLDEDWNQPYKMKIMKKEGDDDDD